MSRKVFVIGGNPDAHAIKWQALKDHFKEIDLSKPHKVTVESYSKRRTTEQSAFMWVWLDELSRLICDHTGMDPGDIHEYFKERFLHPKIITIAGTDVEVRSTKHLTTKEMGEYMDRIHAWAASELGITLPPPRKRE